MLYTYVPNIDEVSAAAIKAGGTKIMPAPDIFYGDSSGGVTDPAGTWLLKRCQQQTREPSSADKATFAKENLLILIRRFPPT